MNDTQLRRMIVLQSKEYTYMT